MNAVCSAVSGNSNASIANCYGQIQFDGVGTEHLPTPTPEIIVDFDTEISSPGVAASHISNNLTINSSGAYDIYMRIEASVDDVETYTIYIALNGAELGSADVEIERKIGELEIFYQGILQGLVIGDVLNFYVASTNGSGASFIPNFLKLKAVKIGGLL